MVSPADHAPTTTGTTTVGALPRTVVLVEGESDRVAVTTLARRQGLDLATDEVEVVAMGGATNVHRYLAHYRSLASEIRLAGLCDHAEQRFFRRALVRSGLMGGAAEDLADVGFFVCRRDLEDELIRSLGTDRVMEVLAEQGERAKFETFSRQPAQRDRTVTQRLHRFLGTHSGRKAQYAGALVEGLPQGVAPPPLAALLAHL